MLPDKPSLVIAMDAHLVVANDMIDLLANLEVGNLLNQVCALVFNAETNSVFSLVNATF